MADLWSLNSWGCGYESDLPGSNPALLLGTGLQRTPCQERLSHGTKRGQGQSRAEVQMEFPRERGHGPGLFGRKAFPVWAMLGGRLSPHHMASSRRSLCVSPVVPACEFRSLRVCTCSVLFSPDGSPSLCQVSSPQRSLLLLVWSLAQGPTPHSPAALSPIADSQAAEVWTGDRAGKPLSAT